MNERDFEPGFIYLFKEWEQTYRHKIGLARDVNRRAKEVGYVDIIHTIPTDNMAITEQELHIIFLKHRLYGEWFHLDEYNIEFIMSIGECKNKLFYLDDGTTWRLGSNLRKWLGSCSGG